MTAAGRLRACVVALGVLSWLPAATAVGSAGFDEATAMAESEEELQELYRKNLERSKRMAEEARREMEEIRRRNAEEEKTLPAVNRKYLTLYFGLNWPDVDWTN